MSLEEFTALDAELRRRFRTRETDVAVGECRVTLLHPENAEELIDESEFNRDERLPYWADLWPSAHVLAQRVMGLEAGRRLLELGCGMGLVSASACLAGLNVCASDYYKDALRFTRLNCWRNAGKEIATRLIDWRDLPAGNERFDFIVASDVLYERSQAPHVARAFRRFLAPTSVGLLADPGRVGVGEFLTEAVRLNLQVGQPAGVPYVEGKIRQTICIYEIRLEG
jgi:ETFB lysine methyltransferase